MWLIDPKTKERSVSLTMMVISFGACVLGLFAKWGHVVGDLNVNEAEQLFAVTAGLYFGRKFQKADTSVSAESELPTPRP